MGACQLYELLIRHHVPSCLIEYLTWPSDTREKRLRFSGQLQSIVSGMIE